MLTLHKTFESNSGLNGKKLVTIWISDGGLARKIKGQDLDDFLSEIKPKTPILLTSTNPRDAVAVKLFLMGAIVRSIHWHAAGVEKKLPASEIAQRFAQIPEEKTYVMAIDAEINKLSALVATRNGIMEVRKAATLRLIGMKRARMLDDDDPLPEDLQMLEDEIKSEKRTQETPVDKLIENTAMNIEACRLFMKIADVQGVQSAAAVVAEIGDINRFPMVSSLWKYAGLDVVKDEETGKGKAPKRKKGQNISWNPNLRCSMWKLAASIMKNRNNYWRAAYERYRAEEKMTHAQKCECKTVDGHCTARALRRVQKDILREFFLRWKGQSESDTQTDVAIESPYQELAGV